MASFSKSTQLFSESASVPFPGAANRSEFVLDYSLQLAAVTSLCASMEKKCGFCDMRLVHHVRLFLVAGHDSCDSQPSKSNLSDALHRVGSCMQVLSASLLGATLPGSHAD